jgi:putative membrane-bound dehydrogenase-like protein
MPRFVRAGLASLLVFSGAITLRAEPPLPQIERLKSSPVLQHLKANPSSSPAQTAPEKTVAQMYVPEGFKVELILGEPDLHQPVAFAFDERGRIWIAEAYSYPQKRSVGQGLDKIVIFEDRDGDGKFETRKVFAEGLNLVSGFEVGYGGVWVGAAPELLFIPDRNHDDVPDGPPQVLLDGFGYQDTHECLNSFLWGPDGWLYGNQGVFNLAHIGKPGAPEKERTELRAGVWRYHPVRHKFEIFAHGGSNPWGLDFDERGQIFMTHCRSYWGGGCTTHVIQGGHFWNQANANYAPFIIANPPAEFPSYRNFLMASARYDHGAGGAGKQGSDAIYGGHSHVGTMIYQGDNWPDEFRGHLFTHNLGGHQINQQINKPLGSGFETVHAGKDQFFCTDPRYVAVDLQSGPDGAVYMIDWYDQQHCHNPDTEHWDRSNGRLYRMEYTSTYQPKKVDLAAQTDGQLVESLSHKNAWYARTAQRLLHERAASGKKIDSSARRQVLQMAKAAPTVEQRLRGLWTGHVTGALDKDFLRSALKDSSEYVRAWAVQFIAEQPENVPVDLLVQAAGPQSTPIVRRYVASAVQRLPENAAWPILRALVANSADAQDRYLPLLIWDSLALRMNSAKGREQAFALKCAIPRLNDYIAWYGASQDRALLDKAMAGWSEDAPEDLLRHMAGIVLALEGQSQVPMPATWKKVSAKLADSSDARIRRQTEILGAVFGDSSVLPRLRTALSDTASAAEERKHAFKVLARVQDKTSLPAFLALLDDKASRGQVLKLLARFDSAEIPPAILRRLKDFNQTEQTAALDVLTSRPDFALALLKSIAAGKTERGLMSAYQVRQLTELRNPEVDHAVLATWGRITQTPAEKQTQITRLQKVFDEAPLWAYDGRAGKAHFQKLCAQCHRIGDEGSRLGPELTGAGKHGIRYFLDNVIDPNAVIGSDFQMTSIDLKNGELVSGLIANETPVSVTLRTTTGEMVIPKTDIKNRATSEKSLMPEGLLEALSEREQLELLKYLTSN